MTDFHMHRYVAFISYSWFQFSDHSLIPQATPFANEACETNDSLGRMVKKCFCSHLTFQRVTPNAHCVCVCVEGGGVQGHSLSNDANWQCYASHK